MPEVFAFPPCPLRDLSHRVADRSATIRRVAGLVWPAARRAERVEVSEEAIEAWSLIGRTRIAWRDVTTVVVARTLLGGRTLRIDAAGRRVEIAPVLPGASEIERRVRAATGS